MSGGGELSGGAFVRGRGGSVDVLRYAMADANPGFGFSRSGNAVYAIVPGFAGNQAPIAADTGAGSPAVGRQVTIGAGVPAGRHLYAAALDLCAVAGRVPRRAGRAGRL